MLAARALAKLGGFMEGELSTPYHQEATAVLRRLLTPRVAAQLKDRSPREMLRNMTSNLETPHVSRLLFDGFSGYSLAFRTKGSFVCVMKESPDSLSGLAFKKLQGSSSNLENS